MENENKIKKKYKKDLKKGANERKELDNANNLILYPNFFDRVIGELSKKIVREVSTRKVVLLCMNGRLVENAELTSYNLLVNDESGAGKDWIVSRILELLPKEQTVKRTRITEKVFTYWHNPRNEPDWTWNGKIFYNEDVSQPVLNSDVFKVMASSGSKATVLIKQTPIDIEIVGKPVLIVTTESSTPNRENIRRFVICNLDTTVDQTKAIMDRQAEYAETGRSMEYDPVVKKALQKLKRVKVKVPYAKLLVKSFPKQKVLMRTHFQRFLDWIKSSAAFYQYQREKDEDGYLLATGQDYEIARECLKKVTSNVYMIPLTRNQRKILEVIKETVDDLLDEWPKITDVLTRITFISERWARVQIQKLIEYGLVEKSSEKVKDVKKPVTTLHLVETELEGVDLPPFNKITSIDSVNTITSNNSINSINNKKSGLNELNELNEVNEHIKTLEKSEQTEETEESELNSYSNIEKILIDQINIFHNKDKAIRFVSLRLGEDLGVVEKMFEKLIEGGVIYESKPGYYNTTTK